MKDISSAPRGFTFFSQSLEKNITLVPFMASLMIWSLTFCNSAVVWPGRNVYRETPLETGVVISALHSGEVGAGTSLTIWAHIVCQCLLFVTDNLGTYQLFISVLTIFFVQSGAAKCACRPKPGQWRAVVSASCGLSGLSTELASKMLHFILMPTDSDATFLLRCSIRPRQASCSPKKYTPHVATLKI